eukprot:scaffold35948_cov32-Tisochrysis_lutea.AAC.3
MQGCPLAMPPSSRHLPIPPPKFRLVHEHFGLQRIDALVDRQAATPAGPRALRPIHEGRAEAR